MTGVKDELHGTGCKAVIFNENGKQLVSSSRKRPPAKQVVASKPKGF